MNYKQTKIEDYWNFQGKLLQELQNIEHTLPEEIANEEEKFLKQIKSNSLGIIISGVIIILGALIPTENSWQGEVALTLLSAVAFLVAFAKILVSLTHLGHILTLPHKISKSFKNLKNKMQNVRLYMNRQGKNSQKTQINISQLL